MRQLQESKNLNRLHIFVGDELFKFNIKSLLSIDENSLDDEAEETIANFGYLSILKAKVGRKLSDLQLQAESTYNRNFNICKDDSDMVKVSDKFAEAQAKDDKEYLELMEQVNQAKEQFYTLMGLVEALRLKVNVIQTISANMRT